MEVAGNLVNSLFSRGDSVGSSAGSERDMRMPLPGGASHASSDQPESPKVATRTVVPLASQDPTVMAIVDTVLTTKEASEKVKELYHFYKCDKKVYEAIASEITADTATIFFKAFIWNENAYAIREMGKNPLLFEKMTPKQVAAIFDIFLLPTCQGPVILAGLQVFGPAIPHEHIQTILEGDELHPIEVVLSVPFFVERITEEDRSKLLLKAFTSGFERLLRSPLLKDPELLPLLTTGISNALKKNNLLLVKVYFTDEIHRGNIDAETIGNYLCSLAESGKDDALGLLFCFKDLYPKIAQSAPVALLACAKFGRICLFSAITLQKKIDVKMSDLDIYNLVLTAAEYNQAAFLQMLYEHEGISEEQKKSIEWWGIFTDAFKREALEVVDWIHKTIRFTTEEKKKILERVFVYDRLETPERILRYFPEIRLKELLTIAKAHEFTSCLDYLLRKITYVEEFKRMVYEIGFFSRMELNSVYLDVAAEFDHFDGNVLEESKNQVAFLAKCVKKKYHCLFWITCEMGLFHGITIDQKEKILSTMIEASDFEECMLLLQHPFFREIASRETVATVLKEKLPRFVETMHPIAFMPIFKHVVSAEAVKKAFEKVVRVDSNSYISVLFKLEEKTGAAISSEEYRNAFDIALKKRSIYLLLELVRNKRKFTDISLSEVLEKLESIIEKDDIELAIYFLGERNVRERLSEKQLLSLVRKAKTEEMKRFVGTVIESIPHKSMSCCTVM